MPLETPDGLKYGPDPRCGEERGYRAHMKHGTEACPACRRAWSERSARVRDNDREKHRKADRDSKWAKNHNGVPRPPQQEARWRDVQRQRRKDGTPYVHPAMGTRSGPKNKNTYKGPKKRVAVTRIKVVGESVRKRSGGRGGGLRGRPLRI